MTTADELSEELVVLGAHGKAGRGRARTDRSPRAAESAGTASASLVYNGGGVILWRDVERRGDGERHASRERGGGGATATATALFRLPHMPRQLAVRAALRRGR